jgi:hypothetical protein
LEPHNTHLHTRQLFLTNIHKTANTDNPCSVRCGAPGQ